MNVRIHFPIIGSSPTQHSAAGSAVEAMSPERPTAGAAVDRPPVEREPVPPPVVEIVIPLYDEAADIEPSVRRLRDFLGRARLRGAPLPDVADLRTPWRRSDTLRQVKRFAAIGVASTLAYVALYAVLRTGISAPIANAVSLIVTAIGNTAANRRLTFDVRGRHGLARDHIAGLVALGVALAVTSASIGLLQAVDRHPARLVEIGVLVVANAVATVSRFVLLRSWIRRPAPALATASPASVPVPARYGEHSS